MCIYISYVYTHVYNQKNFEVCWNRMFLNLPMDMGLYTLYIDGREKEIILRMCCGATSAVVIIITIYFHMIYHRPKPIPHEPFVILWAYVEMHTYGVSSMDLALVLMTT